MGCFRGAAGGCSQEKRKGFGEAALHGEGRARGPLVLLGLVEKYRAPLAGRATAAGTEPGVPPAADRRHRPGLLLPGEREGERRRPRVLAG